MAFGDIVQRIDGASPNASSTSLDITFGSAITEGNLLSVVHMTGDAAGSTGCSSSSGSYTKDLKVDNDFGSEDDTIEAYRREAGASEATTVTVTNAANEIVALGIEVDDGPNGFDSSPLDIAYTGDRSASGSTYDMGPTATTAQAVEFAVAFCYTRHQGNTGNTWSDGFTGDSASRESSDFKSAGLATKTLTATGTISTSYTKVQSASVAKGGIVTYTEASAGGATNPKGPLGHPLHGPLGGPL